MNIQLNPCLIEGFLSLVESGSGSVTWYLSSQAIGTSCPPFSDD